MQDLSKANAIKTISAQSVLKSQGAEYMYTQLGKCTYEASCIEDIDIIPKLKVLLNEILRLTVARAQDISTLSNVSIVISMILEKI